MIWLFHSNLCLENAPKFKFSLLEKEVGPWDSDSKLLTSLKKILKLKRFTRLLHRITDVAIPDREKWGLKNSKAFTDLKGRCFQEQLLVWYRVGFWWGGFLWIILVPVKKNVNQTPVSYHCKVIGLPNWTLVESLHWPLVGSLTGESRFFFISDQKTLTEQLICEEGKT